MDEYGDLVLKANNRADAKMNKGDGFLWFEYTATADGQEYYYMAVCCQSENAFWVVNFATPASNREKYATIFMQWAESINTDNTV